MDQQMVVHPCNGRLLANKEEQATDTSNNMNASKKHCGCIHLSKLIELYTLKWVHYTLVKMILRIMKIK